jgi:hypothetical protein
MLFYKKPAAKQMPIKKVNQMPISDCGKNKIGQQCKEV